MKKIFAVLIAASACTLTATPSFADPASSGVNAAKSCKSKTGAELKSCCQNLTFNQATEAKERQEAAICVKTVTGKKAETKEKAATKK
jgi:hypothetical protein